ncbi:LysR substrate-binding domain-containing protein [Mesorhizobium sp.]|uniref:LysR substrate-binding domain-containing protein n=1 Tax=Mesorhizobium sp. TaxID=1871066 RepID=UPI000FE52F6A|nr:LysR substrate-binding domain-containing protein [Mesorhizobium sp.]RWQ48887.1 MAG: hypothetical protein EOS83_25225 [Mesorhizobium sp.]
MLSYLLKKGIKHIEGCSVEWFCVVRERQRSTRSSRPDSLALRNKLTLVGHSRLKFAPGKRTFTGTSGFDPKRLFGATQTNGNIRLMRTFSRCGTELREWTEKVNLAQGVNLLIEDRYNDLGDGQAEVALRAGPPGNDSLIGRKLSDQSWAVYGSRSYVERSGRPTTPDDLNGRQLIGFEGPIENITPARWLRAIAPDCEIACRSNSVLGLLFAIQSGFGLGLLPCQIGDAEEDIVRVIDPQPGLIGGFWILTHPDLHKRPKNPGILRFHAGGDRQVSSSSARPDTTIAWQSGAI